MGIQCIPLQLLMTVHVLLCLKKKKKKSSSCSTNCKKLSGYSIQDEKCYALGHSILLVFLVAKLYTKHISLELEQNVST